MITTKQQYYDMAAQGKLGNTWWEWKPFDFLESMEPLRWFRDWERVWAVRCMVPGGPFTVDLPWMQAYETAVEVEKKYGGARISPMTYAFPGLRCEGQGYFVDCNALPGLYFHEAEPSVSMRRAFENYPSIHRRGLPARCRLRALLQEDYDWVMELIDLYPEHVVEFSTMSVPCGTMNKRTVIWEVRKY